MSCVALIISVMICLASLHACNARLLSASIDNQTGVKAYHVVVASQEGEKKNERSDETSNTLNMKATVEQEAKKAEERKSHFENLRTSFMKTNVEKFDKSASNIGATSGIEIAKSSYHTDEFPKSTQTKEEKGEARSMLGSTSQATEEEAVDTKENDSLVDDIDMMDYAQPHRKPPIHNEKP